MKSKPILVLGATGYIGTRLVPELLRRGYRVRVGYRSLEKLKLRLWSDCKNIEPVALDVFDLDSLNRAMSGCSTVYYLVHSMEGRIKDFLKADRTAAQNTIIAAENSRVERIIYLGGLGEENDKLSKHLKSRIEVSKILNSCSIPVTTFRAAIIIGAGSAGFEMMRYLVNRLPIMITPKWLSTKNQPIAIHNVLNYLTNCLEVPETIGRSFDIGGPDIVTYKQFMRSYAQLIGLPRRIIISVPFFTPNISSYWIRLITGIQSSLARPLIDGMRNEVVCQENRITNLIPQKLSTHKEAIWLSINPKQYNKVDNYKEMVYLPSEWRHPGDSEWAGGSVFQDHRKTILKAPVSILWHELQNTKYQKIFRIINIYWRFGEFIDKLFKKSKRIPEEISGKWRIESRTPNKEITFRINTFYPGYTLLKYYMRQIDAKTVELHQIIKIVPKGLIGLITWIGIEPIIRFLLHRLLLEVTRTSRENLLLKPQRKPSITKPQYSSL